MRTSGLRLDFARLREISTESGGVAPLVPAPPPPPRVADADEPPPPLQPDVAIELNVDAETQRLVLQAATLVLGGKSWGLHRLALRRARQRSSRSTAPRRPSTRRPSWEREGAECAALATALAAAVSGGALERQSARARFDAFRVECLVDRTLVVAQNGAAAGRRSRAGSAYAPSPTALSGRSVKRRAVAEARRTLITLVLAFARPDLTDEVARDQVALALLDGPQQVVDAWWLGALLLSRDARALLPLPLPLPVSTATATSRSTAAAAPPPPLDVCTVMRRRNERERSEHCCTLRQLVRPLQVAEHGAGSPQQVAEDEALVGAVVDAWNVQLEPLELCRWWAIVHSLSSYPSIEAASSGSGWVLVPVDAAQLAQTPPSELIARLILPVTAQRIRALLGVDAEDAMRRRSAPRMLVPLAQSRGSGLARELSSSSATSSSTSSSSSSPSAFTLLSKSASGEASGSATTLVRIVSPSPSPARAASVHAPTSSSSSSSHCVALARGEAGVRWRFAASGAEEEEEALAAAADVNDGIDVYSTPVKRGGGTRTKTTTPTSAARGALEWSEWTRPSRALAELRRHTSSESGGAPRAGCVQLEVAAVVSSVDDATVHLAGLVAAVGGVDELGGGGGGDEALLACEEDASPAEEVRANSGDASHRGMLRRVQAERDEALASLDRCRKQIELLREAACEAQSLRLQLQVAREMVEGAEN